MTKPEEKLNRALALHEAGEIEKAKNLYQELLTSMPKNDLVWGGLGLIYTSLELYDNALMCMNKALEVSNNPYYQISIGNVYYKKKEFVQSKEHYLLALKTYPNDLMTNFNLGCAYLSLFEIDNAILYLNKTMELDPNIADCHFHLGYAYSEKQEIEKAVKYLLKAIALNPKHGEALFYLSNMMLKLGNLKAGWELYETRFYVDIDRINRIKSAKPLWDGSSLKDKTIYIYHEQGYGDVIMFSRFIYSLYQMGAKVLFNPQPALEQLFKDSGLPARIVSDSASVDDNEFDVHQIIMSLPNLLQIDKTNIPKTDKYLKANPNKVREYKAKYFNNADFKIGIAWKCQNFCLRDTFRSIPDVRLLLPLADVSGVRLYSLQKCKEKDELANLPDNVVDLGSSFNDFSDTAAAIENLDLVVTVDTSIVHLAGALGKKTFTLIEYAADWKWLMNRADSIWYDEIRLFRQKYPRNWESAIHPMIKQVERLVKNHTNSPDIDIV